MCYNTAEIFIHGKECGMKNRILMLISCLMILLTVVCGCVDGNNTDGDDDGGSKTETPSTEESTPKDDGNDPYENDREWNL